MDNNEFLTMIKERKSKIEDILLENENKTQKLIDKEKWN